MRGLFSTQNFPPHDREKLSPDFVAERGKELFARGSTGLKASRARKSSAASI
jgi:hypothetical protein